MALSTRKLKAALLLVDGERTIPEIAAACRVSRSCIHKWQVDPEFKAELQRQRRAVREALDAWRDKVLYLDIVDRARRIERLQRCLDGLDAIRAARAANPAIAKLPGGSTGLVMLRGVQVKYRAVGKKVIREVFVLGKIDAALVQAEMAILDQAAVEMGERVRPPRAGAGKESPRRVISVSEMDAFLRERMPDLSKLSDEDLRTVAALGRKARGCDGKENSKG